MAELRWNPLLRDWTMVASNRQNRPQMPKDYCPFCPGSGKVPDDYEVYKYDNDFPALTSEPSIPDAVGSELFQVSPNYGKCEVVLYSPEHTSTLSKLPVAHIRKVVDLWVERFEELSHDPKHKYILIFENRGEEVGVTMPHPHGQIYAYPYVPQKLRTELASCLEHYQDHHHCLVCDINSEEKSFGQRMLVETNHFISYIPFFTDFPYGAFISCKAHKSTISELADGERDDLARMLKLVTGGMDALFDREFPYMMVLHQAPVNTVETGISDGKPEANDYYHFHIEFYPPLRDKNKIKFLASSETGAWAPCNPVAVEETAVALREAIGKVQI